MQKKSPILSVCLLASSCSAGPVEQENEPAALVQPLAGSFEIQDCSARDTTTLADDLVRTRTIARSEGFLDCVLLAGLEGVPLPQWSLEDNAEYFIGPYPYCSVGFADPLAGETQARQVARIANIAASRIPTVQRCVPVGECGRQACAAKIKVGAPALVKWEDVKTSNGFVMLHELSHSYGYTHSCEGSDGRYAVPHIVSKCLREVEKEIAASPACAAVQPRCGTGEIAVPRYGQYGASDPCQCTPDVWLDENEAGDHFAYAFAVGDFDGDLNLDLAVGAPGEDDGTGVVYVYRNSVDGLRFWKRISQSQLTAVNYQDGTGTFIPENTSRDEFGFALGAGDLNHDGFDDLLIGAPGDNADAGGVFMLPGSMLLGPDLAHVQYIDQRESGGGVEAGDRFGESMVVGDFNGDDYRDFAIGAPDEVPVGGAAPRGAVSFHRGRAGTVGVSSFENSDKMLVGGGDGDLFGTALAAGNIDGAGASEVIVGAPGRNSGNGAAYVLKRGTAWSVSQTLTRTATGFGSVLAVGDFINTSAADLAVGAPNDDGDKGAVFTYRGTSGGLNYSQTLRGDETDQFGAALSVGFVVGDGSSSGKGDLLVTAQGEAFGSGEREGNVLVFSGVTTSVLDTTAVELNQYAFDLASAKDPLMQPEEHGRDRFGGTLVTIPNYRRTFGVYVDDIAVGAWTDKVDGNQSGSIFMFDGSQADRKIDQVTMSLQLAR
jgi:hypothetical protein